jgi:hypothetical protein
MEHDNIKTINIPTLLVFSIVITMVFGCDARRLDFRYKAYVEKELIVDGIIRIPEKTLSTGVVTGKFETAVTASSTPLQHTKMGPQVGKGGVVISNTANSLVLTFLPTAVDNQVKTFLTNKNIKSWSGNWIYLTDAGTTGVGRAELFLVNDQNGANSNP